MLKTIIALYSSMMLILALVLVFLLVGIEVKDISDNAQQNKTPKQILTMSQQNDSQASQLKISTDKLSYFIQEKVNITLENLAQNRMIQSSVSSINVKTREDMGKNYEVAFIEKLIGGIWIGQEAVSRCKNDCNDRCVRTTDLSPKAKQTFVWPQTIFICSSDGDNAVRQATPGQYRISSSAWDEATKKNIVVSSDVFLISNISKK